MKIMLISPPFYRFLGSVSNDVRLSLGYLSAVIRKLGHQVVQYNPDSGDEFATQKELFDNSANFAQSIQQYNHPVYRDVYDEICRQEPDIVGMTVLSGTVVQAEMIAKFCHECGIHVIVGGPMVTLAVDKMMECTNFNQLVAGEAESVMKRVLTNRYQRVIVGIPTGNLNKIPYPDRDNFVGDYADKVQHSAIISSRGCPMQCKYCAHWILGGEIRYRDTDNVIGELQMLVDRYGQKFFRFFDDNFLTNRQRVIDLCARIIKNEMKIEFLIETRVHGLDQSIVDLLKLAGMTKIKLGIESGSQKILNIYKQGLKIEMIKETVTMLQKSGIEVHANWLYGFPEETNDDLRQSINLANELNCKWNTISNLAPYYGTEMFEELDTNQKANWKFFMHNSKMPVLNKNLSLFWIDQFLDINKNKTR
jgi:radical SAM superfamily enzyme YgiQ (UPF0313 family)